MGGLRGGLALGTAPWSCPQPYLEFSLQSNPLPFFFLLSFWLFLRFVTTGRWRYYLLQWVTFVLGFGAHEVMVMYPAVLFAYVVLLDRRHWPRVVLMFFASAGLGWLQWRTVQALASGVYEPHFDAASLVGSLTYYGRSSVAGHEPAVLALLVGIPLLAVAVHQACRKNFLGVFFLAWFLLSLTPYLPAREHRSDYYLVIPTLGLAMLGGWAAVLAMKAAKAYRVAAVVCIGLFLWGLGSKGLSRGELLSTVESRGETADLGRLPSEESSPHEDDRADQRAGNDFPSIDCSPSVPAGSSVRHIFGARPRSHFAEARYPARRDIRFEQARHAAGCAAQKHRGVRRLGTAPRRRHPASIRLWSSSSCNRGKGREH